MFRNIVKVHQITLFLVSGTKARVDERGLLGAEPLSLLNITTKICVILNGFKNNY